RESDAGGAAGDERDLAHEFARRPARRLHVRLRHAFLPAAASAVRVAARLSGSSTFQLAAEGSIVRSRPRSTLPVPSSTKPSTPCWSRNRIDSSQRTLASSCSSSARRISFALCPGLARALLITGQRASRRFTRASASLSPFAAGSISGEWNAPLTSSLIVRLAPFAFARSHAASTAAG